MTKYNQNQYEGRICSVLVSVANIHKEPEYKTEIITQTLLGEQLKIFERNESWLRVSQWDGYEGWINSSAVTEKETPIGTSLTVADLFNGVYTEKSKSSPILRDLVFGNSLVILEKVDDWSRVILPDGTKGWTDASWQCDPEDDLRGQIVKTAERFLGIQYLWGGKSPKGFDCSGFVQTIMHSVGIKLPRDVYQQEQEELLKESTLPTAEQGDLIFFRTGEGKTDHVAITLGEKSIIHSSGFVKIESLDEISNSYNQNLREHISTVKSIQNYC